MEFSLTHRQLLLNHQPHVPLAQSDSGRLGTQTAPPQVPKSSPCQKSCEKEQLIWTKPLDAECHTVTPVDRQGSAWNWLACLRSLGSNSSENLDYSPFSGLSAFPTLGASQQHFTLWILSAVCLLPFGFSAVSSSCSFSAFFVISGSATGPFIAGIPQAPVQSFFPFSALSGRSQPIPRLWLPPPHSWCSGCHPFPPLNFMLPQHVPYCF